MFKIIKKGSGNFWHNFNNGSKEVNLSDWEIVLDSVNQTVSLQMLNGANVPINSVFISDILIIDETDGSVEETFVSVEALRIRLVELNYTPYIVLNGFVPEAPIDGLTYGRKDAEWVEVSGGGGSTPDATESVKGKAQIATEAETISGANDTKIVTPLKLLAVSDALTAEIILKEDALNKVTTFTGNETSTSKFPVVKAILDYFTTSRIKTLLGQASSTVDGWLSSTDWNTFNNKQNVLTDTVLGSLINGFSSKTTPVGADGFLISNSADSNKAYKVSYTNLSATLKSYFDTLYATPALIVKRILNNTVETTPLTGTTSETLIYSAPVIAGGTFSTDDYFNFQLTFRKNGISETACTYRVKVSNTNNYATATLIASWQSQRYNTILQRLNLYFKSNGTLNSPVQTSTNTQTDLTNSSVSLTSISLDPTQDIYFFVSAQLTTSTESVTMNAIKIFN